VVIYGGETWTLTSTDENALRIFERKIYGPVLENGDVRIRYNEELNELIKRRRHSQIHQSPETTVVRAC
jgi:hypothetical protein